MTGVELIAAERKRQIEKEGWTAEHDKKHQCGDLVAAGRSYAIYAWWQLSPHAGWTEEQVDSIILEDEWPWSSEWWKPTKNPIRNLVKAGALIAAEIDKLQSEVK